MNKLYFNQNFNNKLFNPIFNHVEVHMLQQFEVGDEALIYLKDLPLGRVKVVAVHKFTFSKINDVLGYITIGKPAQALAEQVRRNVQTTFKLYADTLLAHIVFQYTERNMQYHQQFLKAWWQEQVTFTDNVFDEAIIYQS